MAIFNEILLRMRRWFAQRKAWAQGNAAKMRMTDEITPCVNAVIGAIVNVLVLTKGPCAPGSSGT